MKPDLHTGRPTLADIRFTRRRVVTHGGGLLATAIAAAAISDALGSTVVTKTTTEPAAAAVSRVTEDPRPYAKYIRRGANGMFEVTDRKQEALRRIRIESRNIAIIRMNPDRTPSFTPNRSVVFNVGKPQSGNTAEIITQVDRQQVYFGLEVAGATYADGQGLGLTKVRKFYEDSESPYYHVGRWFLISDQTGQPIDLQGNDTFYPENFIYISADQAVILPNTPVNPPRAEGQK